MDETINLKKTDEGIVVITQTEVETPLSVEELKRQICQHAEVIATLEAQLKAIETFQASSKIEDSPVIEKQIESIIDSSKLEVYKDVKEVTVSEETKGGK